MKKIKSSTTSNQIKDGVGLGPPNVNLKVDLIKVDLMKSLNRNRILQ